MGKSCRPPGGSGKFTFGSQLAMTAYWNPLINSFLQWFGKPLDWLPAWPLFETIVGALLVAGAVYYIAVVRGQAPDVEADAATGEKTIG